MSKSVYSWAPAQLPFINKTLYNNLPFEKAINLFLYPVMPGLNPVRQRITVYFLAGKPVNELDFV